LKAVRNILLLLMPIMGVTGCHAPPIPDPNDPTRPGPNQTQVLQEDIKEVSDAANLRAYNGEITREQAKLFVNRYEASVVANIDISKIPPQDAWIYGQVFLDAQDWKRAQRVLTIAVTHAKDQDRYVNDTIRLAHAYVELGDVKKAISLVRGTFTIRPQDKAPILPGVLFDITPHALGKGEDVEVAQMLEDSISQEEDVVVNPTLYSARVFLAARPGLITRAWREVLRIYALTGRQDLLAKALKSAQQDEATRRSV
jgi:hypothetical protein